MDKSRGYSESETVRIVISCVPSLRSSCQSTTYVVGSRSQTAALEEEGQTILSPAARWQGCCCAGWADLQGTLCSRLPSPGWAFGHGHPRPQLTADRGKLKRGRNSTFPGRWLRHLGSGLSSLIYKKWYILRAMVLKECTCIIQRLCKMTHKDMENN